MVTLHNNSDEGSLRLNSLLREKHSGTLTFCKLLSGHREALYTEPRDKIYGLVGLAADTIGFHIDYNQSPIEVWVDKLEFIISDGGLSSGIIISAEGFVEIFGLKGHFVGCIVAVGSSPLDTVLNMQNADQWGSEFFQNPPNGLGEAHREKDDLIQRILESNNSELETIPFSHMISVLKRVV
ncbi:hypothetical protein BGAL_0169g00230 [Botrytis galanthina]|uniref:Uncharacterized protein n=1 Tax=Botrytis galanthina TaxID=278940 RepID=A0A4S8QZI0_9HELO|nr:hypothetical protein BGAL_0169g00230 [Botrytis galanthina]